MMLRSMVYIVFCTALSLMIFWLLTASHTPQVRHIDVLDGSTAFNEAVDIPSPVSNPASNSDALKIMIVGDSISHGKEGDYTWRYRLYDWLKSENVDFEFVGPFIGTIRPPDPEPPELPALYGTERKSETQEPNTEGEYAAAFNSNHFAIAGRTAQTVKGLIANVTQIYATDLMLIELGFNDLKFVSGPKGLIANILSLITISRASNPHMKFVVGTVPKCAAGVTVSTELPGNIDSYNTMLKTEVSDWSTEESPIVVAPFQEGYDCGPQYTDNCPATFDDIHPNEIGEFQIAHAYSKALVSGHNIGKIPMDIPEAPKRPLPVPPNFKLSSSPQGVTATWDKVFGAYNYDIEVINFGATGKAAPGVQLVNRWDSKWSREGWKYSVRIKSRAGIVRRGEWSEWQTAIAHPEVAPGPTNISLVATVSGFDVSWTPPENTNEILEYNVYYRGPCDPEKAAAFEGTSGRVTGLRPSNKFTVSIESWTADGPGIPTLAARSVVVGGGTPGTVQNVEAKSKTMSIARITWDAVAGASSYQIWRREVKPNAEMEPLGDPISETCFTSGSLAPNTQAYEWAVSAINGAADGVISKAVVPTPPDGSTVASCPAPKKGCPDKR